MTDEKVLPAVPAGKWRVHAERVDFNRVLDVAFCRDHVDGTLAVVTELTFVTIDRGSRGPALADIALADGEGLLQAALDTAWAMGMRPLGYEDTRESMKALRAHLEDMRKLAFHALVDEPMPVPNFMDKTRSER